MRHITIVVTIALMAAACGGGESDEPGTTGTTAPGTTTSQATTSTTTSLPPETSAPVGQAVVVLSEVVFGDEGYVAITNHGEAAADLEGWQLCQRPAYFALPAIELVPGETLFFALGDASALEGNVIEMGRRIGQLRPSSGEVGLYSSGSFGDPDAIVSYVEWGDPDHGRSSTAVAAGIWVAGDFVETTDTATGIAKNTAEPKNAADWTVSG